MRNETQQSLVMAGINGERYDESCKAVFRNREIMAPILKFVVEEFKDCTLEEIIQCIDADSITEKQAVNELPATMNDMGTEMSAVFEKTIYYDIHFRARNPRLSTEKIMIALHVDFEVQNDYIPRNPTYPIIKRGIYYAAREISAQLGSLTQKSNYAQLEKLYSIWVCNDNIPKELQNTVTRYTFKKEDIIGKTNESEEDYDLMEIILIRRGIESTSEDVFQYLESIFTSNIDKIKAYIDLPKESGIEKEVARMTGLGESLYNKAYNEAYEKAFDEASEEMAIKLVRKSYLRNGDEGIAIKDLQEGLNFSFEKAQEMFAEKIKQ